MEDFDYLEAEERGFSDPRLDAWTAFREGEKVYPIVNVCTECGEEIPEEDDVIEWEDGGRICEECAE